uniref:phosphoribosylaminoimidazole carboxylase n=1 Tax=Hyaloperonospora arabidopsidis (strain Emoy2) TaxID=559515 RepID=M4B4A5_HYAAE
MTFRRVLRPYRLNLMRFPFALTRRGNNSQLTSNIRVAVLSTSSFSTGEDDKMSILQLLQRVADGKVSPQAAAKQCSSIAATYKSVEDFAKIDTTRKARTGFPEVVYAEGKTPEQVAAIMKVMMDKSNDTVMASRVTAKAAESIRALIPNQDLTYYEVPRILASASQAKDVGRRPTDTDEKSWLTTASLASTMWAWLESTGCYAISTFCKRRTSPYAWLGWTGGITSVPVIAVPTSVGYGAAFGGLAPLLTMLNACSPGVGVVNIDNGFGAAVLATTSLMGLSLSS